MATENFVYLTTPEAIKFHVLYMRRVGETRFGVFDRNLIESALARPNNAALYENADIIRQAVNSGFRSYQKSPVGRRQQTHRNFFDEHFSEKKRLQIKNRNSANCRNGFGSRKRHLEN